MPVERNVEEAEEAINVVKGQAQKVAGTFAAKIQLTPAELERRATEQVGQRVKAAEGVLNNLRIFARGIEEHPDYSGTVKEQSFALMANNISFQAMIIKDAIERLDAAQQLSPSTYKTALVANLTDFIKRTDTDLTITINAAEQLARGEKITTLRISTDTYSTYMQSWQTASLLASQADRFSAYAERAETAGAKQLAEAVRTWANNFTQLAARSLQFDRSISFTGDVENSFRGAWQAIAAVSHDEHNITWKRFAEADSTHFKQYADRTATKESTDAYNRIKGFEANAVQAIMDSRASGWMAFMAMGAEKDFLTSVGETTSFYLQKITGEKYARAADKENEINSSYGRVFKTQIQAEFGSTVSAGVAHGLAAVAMPAIGVADALKTIIEAEGNLTAGQWAKVAIMGAGSFVAQLAIMGRGVAMTVTGEALAARSADQISRAAGETAKVAKAAAQAAQTTAEISPALARLEAIFGLGMTASGTKDLVNTIKEKGLDPENTIAAIQQLFTAGVMVSQSGAAPAIARITTKGAKAVGRVAAAGLKEAGKELHAHITAPGLRAEIPILTEAVVALHAFVKGASKETLRLLRTEIGKRNPKALQYVSNNNKVEVVDEHIAEVANLLIEAANGNVKQIPKYMEQAVNSLKDNIKGGFGVEVNADAIAKQALRLARNIAEDLLAGVSSSDATHSDAVTSLNKNPLTERVTAKDVQNVLYYKLELADKIGRAPTNNELTAYLASKGKTIPARAQPKPEEMPKEPKPVVSEEEQVIPLNAIGPTRQNELALNALDKIKKGEAGTLTTNEQTVYSARVAELRTKMGEHGLTELKREPTLEEIEVYVTTKEVPQPKTKQTIAPEQQRLLLEEAVTALRDGIELTSQQKGLVQSYRDSLDGQFGTGTYTNEELGLYMQKGLIPVNNKTVVILSKSTPALVDKLAKDALENYSVDAKVSPPQKTAYDFKVNELKQILKKEPTEQEITNYILRKVT